MTLLKKLRWGLPVVGAIALGGVLLTQRGESAPQENEKGAQDIKKLKLEAELKPVVTLPITQVVLFNSGVAHFTRSGDIENDARVDLTFQENDINDLIKSMTLKDNSANGKISTVTYDSRDPIDRTLRSFAINLNGNPSLAKILEQARGEKIEVTLVNTANQPGNLTGSIIGLEPQTTSNEKGITQTVSVLNMWCAEGVRAVKLSEVQKLRFSNPVIENEFRRALETLASSHDSQKKAVSLHFTGEGKRNVEVGYVTENPVWKTSYRLVLGKDGKLFLQGWAVVENPTDEDWKQVGMALVSGRPISFKMDLYNPLYVPRPTVVPELFAGLRPPTYEGGRDMNRLAGREAKQADEAEALDMVKKEMKELSRGVAPLNGRSGASRDKLAREDMVRKLAEDLDLGKSVNSVATASALGDYYQYVIDHRVDLGRQKSALLPIVNKPVGGARVSIYNPSVQAKHPLLGLRFKNTAGMPLSQGPITVFEGSVYAGDTRVLDMQADEERLISYAIDLGTEVSPKNGNGTSRITSVKAVKGIVYTKTINREERTYDISNRSSTDRTLLIEHPNRKGEGFQFVGTNKPKEEAADVFRFEVAVGAKKDLTYSVIEEREQQNSITLTNNADDLIRQFINLKEAPESLKKQLQEALKMKAGWDKVRQDIQTADRRIQTITADQKRLRENLRELPRESELFKKYLKTLETQEQEMDQLQGTLKTLQGEEAKLRGNYDNYLANLNAE